MAKFRKPRGYIFYDTYRDKNKALKAAQKLNSKEYRFKIVKESKKARGTQKTVYNYFTLFFKRRKK
tara:strand:+ start:744 stop:941 length:198 start_codon:yes stop_codon:yes gene_type:complete